MPRDWKKESIVPVYKVGDEEDPVNYRPVSLTGGNTIICERRVKYSWSKYLEVKNLTTEINLFLE